MVVSVAVGLAVDPNKGRRFKRIYWVIAPLTATTLFATAFLCAHDPPRLDDGARGAVLGAFLSYGLAGSIYLRYWRD